MSFSIVSINIRDIKTIEFSVPVYMPGVEKWFREIEIIDTDGKRVLIGLFSDERGGVEPDYRMPLKPVSKEASDV